MIIVQNFSKCFNRYICRYYFDKKNFLLLPNAEVELLKGLYCNDLTRNYDIIACQIKLNLTVDSKTCKYILLTSINRI